MTEPYRTWGYRAGESRIFELPGDKRELPPGWYDSPARIPEEDKARVAAAQDPPASVPSIDEQELAEAKRLLSLALADNEKLQRRVTELEERLAAMEALFHDESHSTAQVPAADSEPEPPPPGALDEKTPQPSASKPKKK